MGRAVCAAYLHTVEQCFLIQRTRELRLKAVDPQYEKPLSNKSRFAVPLPHCETEAQRQVEALKYISL